MGQLTCTMEKEKCGFARLEQLLQENPLNPTASVKTQALFPLPLTYLYVSCWDQVTRSRQWKSCVCNPRLRELLASVSIQTARKACEGDVGGLRRVVYCIHLPGDRTQSRDSTSRQKTWTTQSRAAVKLDRYQLG